MTQVYELVYSYPNGGYITENGRDTSAFIQGDDYQQLEDELDRLWKQVTQKKMGRKRAAELQDSLLSNYIPD